MADEKKPGCSKEDVVFMGPPTEDGSRPFVRHRSDCTTQAGLLQRIKEGQPVHNGALLLESRPNEPGAYDVRNTYKPEKSSKSGPAQVATPAYRNEFDRIFGGSQTVGQA